MGYFPVNTHAHNTGTLSLTNWRSYQILGTVAARGAAKSRVVSILNHGLMTWMIWGTAIRGHSTYIGDYHDPASNSRENVAGFEHCSSWGVNSKLLLSPGFITVNFEKTGPKMFQTAGLVAMNQIHGETTTFWVVVLARVTLVRVWFLHCVYSQIQTCYCTPW